MAVVMIYFNKKYVVDIQKTPLMPFNELLGCFSNPLLKF